MALEFSASFATLAKALFLFQGETRGVPRDAINDHFRNRYVTLDAVIETARPALQKAGIVFTQAPGETIDGSLEVITMLIHAESGEWMRASVMMPLLKRDPQSIGSAWTYGARYSLMSILGLPPTDDDDGEKGRDEAPAPAKKVVNGPSKFPEQPAPTLLQRALDDMTGYLMVVDKVYSRTKTVDDLNDRAEHYDNADIRNGLFPMDADRLKQLYERHLQRIRG